MKRFELDEKMNESELFKLFGKYARFLFNHYVITFNGKDFSADNPTDLFTKVKEEYKDYVEKRKKEVAN